MKTTTIANVEPSAEKILGRLREGTRIRAALPSEGRIFIDRPLPFLSLYRRPPNAPDDAPRRLISGGASYMIVPDRPHRRESAIALCRSVALELAGRFDSVLVLELREADPEASGNQKEPEQERPFAAPTFRIGAFEHLQPSEAVTELRRGLGRIRVLRERVRVAEGVVPMSHMKRGGLLFSSAECKRRRIYYLILEITPTYRDSCTGETYPTVIRTLRRGIQRAINQAFFAFARTYTNTHPKTYYTLGRRSFVKAVWEVDRRLAELESSFDLIVQSSPINVDSAWTEFKRCRFETAPRFLYRPLPVDPPRLKRRLFSVPIERIEDASIAYILHEKQNDIDRRITMLSDIGTSRFRYGSCQVFGTVQPDILRLAREILLRVPPRTRKKKNEPVLIAQDLAELATREIAKYRAIDPSLAASASVRDDIHTGMIVSKGDLFIGRKMSATATRARSLLAHEVGVHILTYHNGTKQPFHQLAQGLAGYNAFQEGLAVIAEFLDGGLSGARLRTLAGRVFAVDAMLGGAGFVDVFRRLNEELGFSRQIAFTMTTRVFRAGGLTKDALYLKGVVEILDYLKGGGDLRSLWIGKIAAGDMFLVNELRLRGVLERPALLPRFLDGDGFQQRYERLLHSQSPLDLVDHS